MKGIFFSLLFFSAISVSSQVSMGVLQTNRVTDKQLAEFKKKAIKDNPNASLAHIQYMVDVFVIDENKEAYANDGVNMQGVADWAFSEYDKLMNRVYKLLSADCDAKLKTMLVTMQKAWLTYMDSEMKFWQERYKDDLEGTIGSLLITEQRIQWIKDRCAQLENWRENKSLIGE